MVTLFHDKVHKEIEVYVNDMIAKSAREESHVENLCKLFERLRKYKFKLNPAKYTFEVKPGKLLGFIVRERGIKIDSDKFRAIQDLTPSKTQKDVRAWATRRLRQYMLHYTIFLISKSDPLKYIFKKPSLSGRVARWQVVFSEYDIVYMSQKAIKGSTVVEFLANRAKEEYEPMSFDFPDEDIMSILKYEEEIWRVYFDGASKMIGHGIGAVLISSSGQYFPAIAKLMFTFTNNVAEYNACILALQIAIEKKIRVLKGFGDSALVVYQLRGEWETRDFQLIHYQTYVHGLIKNFDDVQFFHLPREENQFADALATLAAMFKVGSETEVQPIQLRVKDLLAHCAGVELGIDGKPWYVDFKRYLQYQQPSDCASGNDK
ncbi:uncharacterized protein [Gossypium hirsutum]|uniref:Uncharacterized protein n=1 Tax=Gossypium hirsutum TaxID=3635 RepID=A0A1U8IBT1_GOSHI|nr:uncharacterized protein LOC107892692 [Gossypium hirsutum]